MGLKELNGNRRSSSLLFSGDEGKETDTGKNPLLLVGLVVFVFSLLSMLTIGAVTCVMLDNHKSSEVDYGGVNVTNGTSTTTTTTTTTTTITIPTTTTTTTTTTTSTTTTTLCGGFFQQPCEDGNCSEGFMVGSLGLCQPVECNPSIPSGKNGCGEWAFKFCN